MRYRWWTRRGVARWGEANEKNGKQFNDFLCSTVFLFLVSVGVENIVRINGDGFFSKIYAIDSLDPSEVNPAGHPRNQVWHNSWKIAKGSVNSNLFEFANETWIGKWVETIIRKVKIEDPHQNRNVRFSGAQPFVSYSWFSVGQLILCVLLSKAI